MPQSLILFRSSNFDGNSKLIYKLPNTTSLKGREVALQSFSFHNSFYNVDDTNNKVDVYFPNFSTTVQNSYTMKKYSWTLTNGFYSLENLNLALEQFQLANKLCLYNASTQKYTYFLKIFPNTVAYKTQLQVSYVPSLAQATALGLAQISGATWNMNIVSSSLAATQVAPYIVLNAGIGKITGISTLQWPTAVQVTSNINYNSNFISVLSQNVPMVNPVDSVILRSNISNNSESNPIDILSITPISSSYGSLTQFMASELVYVPCLQTNVSQIELQMCDQNLTPLFQRDPEITLVLAIRDIKP